MKVAVVVLLAVCIASCGALNLGSSMRVRKTMLSMSSKKDEFGNLASKLKAKFVPALLGAGLMIASTGGPDAVEALSGGRSGGASFRGGGGGGGGSSFSNSQSVDFDGTNDHALPASTITLSGNKSISLWAKLDKITGLQNFTSPNGTQYGITTNSNIVLYVRTSVGVNVFNFSGSPWSSGVWNHWAITGDGSDLKLYINGNAVGGTQTDGDILIARFFSITTSYFVDGKIDEFALFNSTLSSSDITAIYNSGVAADLASYSPLHWWRMGDINGGSGTTIADQGSADSLRLDWAV